MTSGNTRQTDGPLLPGAPPSQADGSSEGTRGLPNLKKLRAPREVARLHRRDLIDGFVKEFARACREGIPAELLTAAVAMVRVNDNDEIVHSLLETQRQTLLARIGMYEMEFANATTILGGLPPDATEMMRTTWVTKQNELSKDIERIRGDLEKLESMETHDQPDRIETYGEQLDRAFTRLIEQVDGITPEQNDALISVLDDFRAVPDDDGIWWASTNVVLPAPDGRVGMLGPLRWYAGTGGRGNGSARRLVGREKWHPTEAELLDLLHDLRELTDGAQTTLANAPFPELALTVAHGLDPAAHPFPDWVDDDWRQPAFIKWVKDFYTGKQYRNLNRGAHGHYAAHLPLRQALAYFAADRYEEVLARTPPDEHGRVDLKDVVDRAGFQLQDFKAMLNASLARSSLSSVAKERTQGAIATLHPPVARTGNTRLVRHHTVLCDDCSVPATFAIRVPDVPRDLLCARCMRMPLDLGAFGMEGDVIFPKAYRTLMRSQEACLKEIRSSALSKPWTMNEFQQRIIEHLRVTPDGASTEDLMKALDVHYSKLRTALEALESRLHITGERASLFVTWRLHPLRASGGRP